MRSAGDVTNRGMGCQGTEGAGALSRLQFLPGSATFVGQEERSMRLRGELHGETIDHDLLPGITIVHEAIKPRPFQLAG